MRIPLFLYVFECVNVCVRVSAPFTNLGSVHIKFLDDNNIYT